MDEQINSLLDHISSSSESVETISTCSDHQRRLISDILSLSKQDSQLLQINPAPVLATSLLEDVRKMFETEAERVGVRLEIDVDTSISKHNVGQVNLDSGRILQVLINLVSNAIKFTKNEKRGPRRIRIVMGASDVRPLDLPVDSFHNPESIYDTSEGQDEFYLWFTVTDSGRGLSAEEKARIFTRVSLPGSHTAVLPSRVQNFATLMAVKMHNDFYTRDLPRESQGRLVSRWILSCFSKPLCLLIFISVTGACTWGGWSNPYRH